MRSSHTEARPRLRLADAAGKTVTLTRAETKVLSLLAEGMDIREIAEVLFVTVKTVNFHICGLNRALGVRSARKAVALAYETRLREGVTHI